MKEVREAIQSGASEFKVTIDDKPVKVALDVTDKDREMLIGGSLIHVVASSNM